MRKRYLQREKRKNKNDIDRELYDDKQHPKDDIESWWRKAIWEVRRTKEISKSMEKKVNETGKEIDKQI